jgi:polar amino acid transport system substrate-binding protein
LAVLAVALANPALAQRPPIPDAWAGGKRQDPSALRYCIDSRDPDRPVAEAIGGAIAAALLLEPKVHVVEAGLVTAEFEELYPYFFRHCDIHLGFKLIPGAYPDWLVVSRPYYTAGYGVVVKDARWSALADIPPGAALGPTIGTAADLRLANYLLAIDAARRWLRHPQSSNEVAIAALAAGQVSAALVWLPALWAEQRREPALAGLRVVAPRPLPPTSFGVGAGSLSEESFVRSQVDRAIASLVADGTIPAILERFKFPAKAGE